MSDKEEKSKPKDKSEKKEKKTAKTVKAKSASKGAAKKKSSGGMTSVIAREHNKAKKVKISRKELKKDEFKEFSTKVVDYLTAHGNNVLIIAGTVLIVLLVFVFVSLYRSSRREKASELFTKARNLYDLALNDTPISTGTLKGSLEMFDSLTENFSGGMETKLAQLYKGNIYFNLQEHENAIEAYNKFLSSDLQNSTYEIIAKTNIAYSYENINEFGKAIEYFKEVSDMSQGFVKENSLLELGLAYENAGRKDEAAKIYQDFIKEYPTSGLTEKAQERINSIQAN